ncbi:hypothetical protein PHISCL_10275, partial [Aspergillus sclerotialis]
MVFLVITPRILSALDSIPPSSREDLKLPPSPELHSPISHDQIIRLSRHLRTNTDHADGSLNSLLRGTKVYKPPPPKKPEPSPEYLALKARLLAAAEKDEYARLMNPASIYDPAKNSPASIFTSSTPALSSLHDPHSSSNSESDTDPLTPSLVLNIFLSILLTGFSVYWALTSFQTSELNVPFISPGKGRGMSEPVRVLASLVMAVVVGVAEV